MLQFILRRIAISALIMFLGSVLMYVLTINSGDPLSDLRESRAENRDQLMAARTANMGLDDPWWLRYLGWLTGVSRCFVLQCDLGDTRDGSDVNNLLLASAGASLRLVTVATFLAIFIGVTLGVLSAIRQYSGFDYAVTFIAFLFFSLPVFWAAVLLKDFGAIRFNNWIADPTVSTTATAVVALLFALAVASVLGGGLRRELITGAVTFVVVFGLVFGFDQVTWWVQPAIGLPLIIVGALAALGFMLVMTVGLSNRKVMYAGLVTIGLGLVAYFVTGPILDDPSGWLVIIAMALLTVAVGLAVGWVMGGYERRTAMIVSVGTGLGMAFLVFMDYLLRGWAGFLELSGNRPVSTIGENRIIPERFTGDFWEGIFNWGVQLVLPTIVLTLISIASYSRYTRGSMLETINQDYIRTARSKGLSDRVVFTKHALRNALIPITTIVAFDFASLLGGAVITESVFGWRGLGAMFRQGLDQVDPNPVMAYYLVAGGAAVLMNMLADIAYASLDPRIRR
ncbi:Oligopeptide transport system permease protein OppB [Serinicoccus hydrothermalis]|uniref:Oligopeptide transport system permease protein OppB n=1 Tax=Serinicoccus hydrothermalis TaxID=1758689 RepID=A0A1B1N844_9MICO|nr:ABC transporter permease [Serinicoccus hydrothermalis]ANS77600.1 Oligopeptide transport system permease protein OppB [Serinicoccus hydrothermalis]